LTKSTFAGQLFFGFGKNKTTQKSMSPFLATAKYHADSDIDITQTAAETELNKLIQY